MSKSKGNLVPPEEYYRTVGADGLRLFHLFAGPPADDLGLDGPDRTTSSKGAADSSIGSIDSGTTTTCTFTTPSTRAIRTCAKRSTAPSLASPTDFNRWSYNTAVAALMELLNTVSKAARSDEGIERATLDEALDTMALLLAPMAPHITAELWEERYPDRPSVHLMAWPVADPELVKESEVTMVVQINGKVKARLLVVAGDQ